MHLGFMVARFIAVDKQPTLGHGARRGLHEPQGLGIACGELGLPQHGRTGLVPIAAPADFGRDAVSIRSAPGEPVVDWFARADAGRCAGFAVSRSLHRHLTKKTARVPLIVLKTNRTKNYRQDDT